MSQMFRGATKKGKATDIHRVRDSDIPSIGIGVLCNLNLSGEVVNALQSKTFNERSV